MKKVFTPDGEYLGRAIKIETTENGVEITMPGDFPGMAEKTVIYVGGSIVYEDENRVYIKYYAETLHPGASAAGWSPGSDEAD